MQRLTGDAAAPRGTLGCFLSHAAAWEALLDGDAPHALIIEDDVIPLLDLPPSLDALPLPLITSGLCIFLIALFFISGADAAAITMATMASRGSLEPPKYVVLVLGGLMAGIACAMLLVGGLTALQQAAILGSVPFTFVLIGVAYCWVKALREERRPSRDPDPPAAVGQRSSVTDDPVEVQG